jgi:hypothetical protein
MVLMAFLASIAVVGGGLLILVLLNSPLLGTGLVLSLFALEAAFISLPGIALGIFLYPQDLVFGLLFITAVLRQLLRPRWSRIDLGWMLFVFIVFLSFVRGLSVYGAKGAGTDFRGYFYLVAGALYLRSFALTEKRQRHILDQMLLAAWALLVLAVFRWSVDLLHFGSQPWRDLSGNRFRVLTSHQALFLAAVFIAALHRQLGKQPSRRWRYSSVVLLPAILLLQHRSVWIASLVGVFATFLFAGRRRGRAATVIASVSVASAVVALTFFGSDISEVGLSLSTSAQSAFSSTGGTFVWRIEGWQALLETGTRSATDNLIGQPFGSGFLRYVRGARIEVQPHNFYVQTFLRAGGVGLLALVVACGSLVARAFAWRTNHYGDVGYPRLFGIFILMQLTYWIAYAPSYSESVLLGLSLSCLAGGRFRTQLAGRVLPFRVDNESPVPSEHASAR